MNKGLPLFLFSVFFIFAGCKNQIQINENSKENSSENSNEDSKINISLNSSEKKTGTVTLCFADSSRTVYSDASSEFSENLLTDVNVVFVDEATNIETKTEKDATQYKWTLTQGTYSINVSAKMKNLKMQGSIKGVEITEKETAITLNLYPVYDGEGIFTVSCNFYEDWNTQKNPITIAASTGTYNSGDTISNTGMENHYFAVLSSYDGETQIQLKTEEIWVTDGNIHDVDGLDSYYFYLDDLTFKSEEVMSAGLYIISVLYSYDNIVPIVDNLIEFVPEYPTEISLLPMVKTSGGSSIPSEPTADLIGFNFNAIEGTMENVAARVEFPRNSTISYYWYLESDKRTTSFTNEITGEYLGIIPVPTKTGQEFAGWCTLDGEDVCYPNKVLFTSDTTLKAKWSDPCTINFVTNCDMAIGSITVPSDFNYIFAKEEGCLRLRPGMQDGAGQISYGNNCLYAIYESDVNYPIKSGSTLQGWYLDEELTCPISGTDPIIVSANGNVSIYAKWE